jgi:predicted HAD superfamily Cof-like phosphohydrolase
VNIIEKATEFSRDFEFFLDNLDEKQVVRGYMLNKTLDFIHEEIKETADAINNNDREEIIDGFGDVAFIALNGIYKEFRTSGDDHYVAYAKTVEVMHRICNANLAKKHPDGSIQYKNGKVQKPEGWTAPTYGDLL